MHGFSRAILVAIGTACLFAAATASGKAQDLNPTGAEIDAWVQADANADGTLSKSEFIVFVKAMAETGQATARRIRFFRAYGYAFSVADKNRDGILTPEEMRAADDNYRAEQ